jgi:hypothetical protein
MRSSTRSLTHLDVELTSFDNFCYVDLVIVFAKPSVFSRGRYAGRVEDYNQRGLLYCRS